MKKDLIKYKLIQKLIREEVQLIKYVLTEYNKIDWWKSKK
jgi:hypothetical protein